MEYYDPSYKICYYPKPSGALNSIYPASQSDRYRLIVGIERRGGLVVGRSEIADAFYIVDKEGDK